MPTTLLSDVLTPRQLAFIAERLPEPARTPRGRRPYANLQLLPGILRVLRSGCRWRDLDQPGSPSGVTHWRRLRYWHRRTGYRNVWRSLLNILLQSKRLDRSLVSLDGTLIPSQEFTEQTGYSGKHRAVGTKLSLLVDRAGTPIAVSVAPGNYHDGVLGFLTLANIYTPPPILRDILPDAAKTAEPTLLADKGYDSRRFRQFVHEHGFRPLIPTRSCIPSEQATGELYAVDTALERKRYVVERTLGWLKGFRRLRYRVDRTAASFHAFIYLAVLVLCVRRLISQSQARPPVDNGVSITLSCEPGSRNRRNTSDAQPIGALAPTDVPALSVHWHSRRDEQGTVDLCGAGQATEHQVKGQFGTQQFQHLPHSLPAPDSQAPVNRTTDQHRPGT
jgi:transposase